MRDFDTFLKNFEAECFRKRKSPSAVCVEIGLSTSAYSYWKKERSLPRIRTLTKLAEYFGITVSELTGESDEDPKINHPVTELSKTFGSRPVTIRNKLPIYGFVSAGPGVWADSEIIGYEFADEKYSAPEYFWLEVDGDSMSPRIDEGDLVLVHKQEWIESGQIGIFVVDDNAYVKRIEYKEKELDLISFNPFYPPMRFKPEEEERVHVVGRVIESKRKYL